MHFSRMCRYGWVVWVGLCCLSVGLVAGCKDNTTEQNEVFADAEKRVRTLLLPGLNHESQAVLRNLVNVLTVFPEVCATPLASMGAFTSLLPTLGRPATTALDDAEGAWIFTWSNVVLGDVDLATVDPDAAPVDMTMTVTFLSHSQDEEPEPLHAIPFSLTPQTALQTVGIPPSFATGTTEGFFLYQDAETGAWTLRWRAVEGGENRFFSGTIAAASGISRLIRHPGDPGVEILTSDSPGEAIFSTHVAAGNDQGFTFYVRPGEPVQFLLRIGTSDSNIRDISTSDLRIGADNAPPPNNGDFSLSSNEPIDPTGDPLLTLGADRGTFLWQDTTTIGCLPGEDQWRLRFTAPNSNETFSGVFIGGDDDASVAIGVTAVVPCLDIPPPQGHFDYMCPLGSGQIGGYDICVPGGTRVTLDALINDIRDPALVRVGAARSAPPSPDPFTIRFDIELEERNSARQIKFPNASLVLRGNNEESDLKLDPEQVSLEPPCVAGKHRLLARITGEGDYSTDRVEGSHFIMDNVEFLNDDTVPEEFRRFPDRGVLRLETSVNSERAEVQALMDMIGFQVGQLPRKTCNTVDMIPSQTEEICSATVVSITVNRVQFTFPDEFAVLTVD